MYTVCSEKYMKPIGTLFGKNVELVTVTEGGTVRMSTPTIILELLTRKI
jgi:hypothetical protein